MEISVFTNHIHPGWHSSQLEQFLGGNEESLVLWSREMAKFADVKIYTSLPIDGLNDYFDGEVQYLRRETFDFNAHYDVLISFKDGTPWMKAVSADVKIHWCNDVENAWPIGLISQVQKIVNLGPYHESRLPWVPEGKHVQIPLGMDKDFWLDDGRERSDLMIYTSSPDRGLATLLEDWSRIRSFLGESWDLVATYAAEQRAPYLRHLLNQPGVRAVSLSQDGMAELYRSAKIWVHPLNRFDSDLAGVSAHKATVAGCKLSVNQVEKSGFRDAVDKYIPYWALLKGHLEETQNPNCTQHPIGWSDVVKDHWLPLIKSLREATP